VDAVATDDEAKAVVAVSDEQLVAGTVVNVLKGMGAPRKAAESRS
jgi:hypothetical protein